MLGCEAGEVHGGRTADSVEIYIVCKELIQNQLQMKGNPLESFE